jgi:hypothetical protein
MEVFCCLLLTAKLIRRRGESIVGFDETERRGGKSFLLFHRDDRERPDLSSLPASTVLDEFVPGAVFVADAYSA